MTPPLPSWVGKTGERDQAMGALVLLGSLVFGAGVVVGVVVGWMKMGCP